MKKIIPSDAVLIPENAQCVFRGKIFDVYQWPQKMFDGSTATFEMLKRPDSAVVIGVVDDKLIVIEEEQPHSGTSLAFPGGRADQDDDALVAAKREMLEETGHKFENWRLISVKQPHTKLEWFVHIFLAWGVLSVEETFHDAGERITVKQLGFAEVKRLSLSGRRYIDESCAIFENLDNLRDLLALSEFTGQEADR